MQWVATAFPGPDPQRQLHPQLPTTAPDRAWPRNPLGMRSSLAIEAKLDRLSPDARASVAEYASRIDVSRVAVNSARQRHAAVQSRATASPPARRA